MSSNHVIKNSEAIISIEARGFIFGSAISLQACKPMIVARKPESFWDLIQENYNLEYGKFFINTKGIFENLILSQLLMTFWQLEELLSA